MSRAGWTRYSVAGPLRRSRGHQITRDSGSGPTLDSRLAASPLRAVTGSGRPTRALLTVRADGHRDPVIGSLAGPEAGRRATQAIEGPAGRQACLRVVPCCRQVVARGFRGGIVRHVLPAPEKGQRTRQGSPRRAVRYLPQPQQCLSQQQSSQRPIMPILLSEGDERSGWLPAARSPSR